MVTMSRNVVKLPYIRCRKMHTPENNLVRILPDAFAEPQKSSTTVAERGLLACSRLWFLQLPSCGVASLEHARALKKSLRQGMILGDRESLERLASFRSLRSRSLTTL